MEAEISKLPPGILKSLSNQLAYKIAKLVCTYGGNYPPYACRPWFKGKHDSVCKAVFRSVLTRFVERFGTNLVKFTDGGLLMVQNLDSVPGLLELSLYTNVESCMLADMVHHVKNLQIFKYHHHCTDEIIAELQRHCPHLMELDVSYSPEGTNASVQPLIVARKLKLLYLDGTGIDDDHYAMILSELRNITNITLQESDSCFLRQIAVERLNTVRQVIGFISDIETVAHKCPNTTTILMHPVAVDLSGLTAFNALSALRIHDLHYGNSNLKAVLQGAGHRLTELKLHCFDGLVLQDIITLCPSLAHLSLVWCEFLNLNSDTQFDPQLPHFRNLITLEVGCFKRTSNVCRFIPYYVSLKTI
jgi:hypothetical protein